MEGQGLMNQPEPQQLPARYRFVRLISVLMLAACSDNGSPAAPVDAEAPPQIMDGAGDPHPLTCSDALSGSFRFLGPETVELTVALEGAQQTYVLTQQVSASGARYLADDVEFWNKGREAMLEIGEARYRCSIGDAGAG